jgi:hypothetical protein
MRLTITIKADRSWTNLMEIMELSFYIMEPDKNNTFFRENGPIQKNSVKWYHHRTMKFCKLKKIQKGIFGLDRDTGAGRYDGKTVINSIPTNFHPNDLVHIKTTNKMEL